MSPAVRRSTRAFPRCGAEFGVTSPRAPDGFGGPVRQEGVRNGADDPANQPSAEGLEHGHTFQVGKHMFWVKQEQHGERGCVALIVWLANMLKTCPGDTKKHQWTFTLPGWVTWRQRNIKSSCCYSRVVRHRVFPSSPMIHRTTAPRRACRRKRRRQRPPRNGTVSSRSIAPSTASTAEPNPARAAARLHCSDQNGRCDTATNRAYGAPWSWYWSTTRWFTWRCRARINTARRAFHAPAWACASLHGPWRPPEHTATP